MTALLNTIADKWFTWQFAMLWQTAVLIAIIWTLDMLIRRWAWPQVRYALWLLVLVKLLIPPTFTSPASITSHLPASAFRAAQSSRSILASEQMPVPVLPPQLEIIPNVTRASSPRDTQRGQDARVPLTAEATVKPTPSLSWEAWAMFVWLSGIVVLSAWLIIRLRGLRKEYLKGEACHGQAKLDRATLGCGLPERFNEQLESAANKLNLKRLPAVILSEKVSRPAVFGVFRPVLLMPAEKFKSMSKQDTEHVLLHELAHIKRGDLLVHAVYMILQIVYWFNPLLWLIRKTLQNLRELCCDATVAKLLREDTAGYRQTLLETARQLLAEPVEPGLGLLGLFENSNWLVTRLQWLEKNTWKNRPLRIVAIILLVSVMTVCVLPMANRQKAEDKSQRAEDFTVTLPNGITVELVSVCEYPSEGKPWWKPDGSPCDLDIQTDDHSKYPSDDPGYGLVFRKTGEESFKIHSVKGSNVNSGIQVLKPDELTGFRVHIKSRYNKTDVKIASPSGRWQTVHTSAPQPQGSTSATVNGKTLVLSAIIQAMNAAIVSCSDELGYKDATRIIAIDPAGNEYTGTILADAGVNNIRQRTIQFTVPITTSIAKISFQTCPYEYYTFKDVALRPKKPAAGDTEDNDFKVTGMVTDAQTNAPIAGADVYDNGYDNIKCRTTTDESGRFTLKTANEEHTISAKAQGYQPQSKTLKTFPFANNENFNFALVPTTDTTFKQILEQAEAEARSLNHEYIGTEHLLLALVSDKDAAASVILKELGVDAKQVRLEIGKLIEAGPAPVTKDYLPLNQRAKKSLFYAKQEAERRNQDSVTSEDVLLGLLQVQDGVAAGVLSNLGVNLEKAQEARTALYRTETTKAIVEAALMGPDLGQYMAFLPNGVTVELVGVCEHPSKGKQWWKPDGSELKDRPWEKINGSVSPMWGHRAYEFALKLNYPVDNVPGHYVHIGTGSSASGGIQQFPTSFLRWEISELPKKLEMTDVNIAIASGQWQTRSKQKSPWHGVYVQNVVWQAPIAVDDKTVLSVSHSFATDESRLVAIDIKGNQHIGYGTGGSIDKKTVHMQHTFNVKLDEIKEFQLQTRPYEHYTFKNVSLRPGVKTDVQIETKNVETPSNKDQQISWVGTFEITKQSFLENDWIEITHILGPSYRLEVGQTYTIKGKYKLSSRDKAMLHIYATNGEIQSEQGPVVERGSGEFTRTFTYLKKGWLHLSFYPAEGGSSFGSLYFAEKGSNQQAPDMPQITSFVKTSQTSRKSAPLHYAAMGGHRETAEILLAEGMEINAKDANGNTPLHLAAANGYPDLCEFLIEKGADVNPLNNTGQTPLDMAAMNGHKATAQSLIAKGAVSKPEEPIDITPAGFEMRFDPKRLTFNLVVSIQNQNAVAIPKHRIRYHRGDPNDGLDETGNPHSGWHEAGPLEPDKTWNERTRDFHLPDGDYTFTVVLDYDNAIPESNEANNRATLHVTIKDGQIVEKAEQSRRFDLTSPSGFVSNFFEDWKKEARNNKRVKNYEIVEEGVLEGQSGAVAYVWFKAQLENIETSEAKPFEAVYFLYRWHTDQWEGIFNTDGTNSPETKEKMEIYRQRWLPNYLKMVEEGYTGVGSSQRREPPADKK